MLAVGINSLCAGARMQVHTKNVARIHEGWFTVVLVLNRCTFEAKLDLQIYFLASSCILHSCMTCAHFASFVIYMKPLVHLYINKTVLHHHVVSGDDFWRLKTLRKSLTDLSCRSLLAILRVLI